MILWMQETTHTRLRANNMKQIIKKVFTKKKTKATATKEPEKKLPTSDYDGMGNFKRFGRP